MFEAPKLRPSFLDRWRGQSGLIGWLLFRWDLWIFRRSFKGPDRDPPGV